MQTWGVEVFKKGGFQTITIFPLFLLTCRSFFSAFFEPASSSPIGNCILYSNHSMKLLVLIGFLRNLQKCDLNLPDISCSGSPLLYLCVKNFLFCNCFHFYDFYHMFLSVLNWDVLLQWKHKWKFFVIVLICKDRRSIYSAMIDFVT